MFRLPFIKSRKPVPEKSGKGKAATEKRWAGNVEVKVDVAACIRNCGLVIFVLLATMKPPGNASAPPLAQIVEAFVLATKGG